jgi:spore maturation protein SpmA
MFLNRLWIGLFLIAVLTASIKTFVYGDMEVFSDVVLSMFDSAKTGFEISLYLTGVLALWMGIMKIGEEGGAVRILTKIVAPLFTKLFPELPKDHPAFGTIMLNYSANMLGLDNAATPIGLKAMGQLQELNTEKDTASNAQIMFLVLNTSGLTIIPVTILAYRMANGSANPSEVFLPILLATFISTMAGLIFVSIRQRINLLQPVVLAYLGSLTLLVGGIFLVLFFWPAYSEVISKVLGNFILLLIIISFILLGVRSKINVYDAFIDGAKGGFDVAIKIIPFLVAILVAVGVFRASGAMDMLMDGIKYLMLYSGVSCTEFVDALPTGLMKPFSGSGARGMMLDVFAQPELGPDSFAGRLASIFQGSTETTFYVLSVYFGSVQIKRIRYAAWAGLFADIVGIIAAIVITFMFFSC